MALKFTNACNLSLFHRWKVAFTASIGRWAEVTPENNLSHSPDVAVSPATPFAWTLLSPNSTCRAHIPTCQSSIVVISGRKLQFDLDYLRSEPRR